MNKDELIQRRDELRGRIAAIRRDLAGGLDDDLEEQAQQLENYDTLLEIARVAEEELGRVEQALSQIEQA
jgi:RNA polymerase-binding transcription factor DksA